MKRDAINYSKMRSADRSLERNLIGPNRLIDRDSPVLPRLIDWFLKNPLELTILHFLLAACMWVMINRLAIPMSWETNLKPL